jgi:hypothetical protein
LKECRVKNFRVPRDKLSMEARLLHYAIVSLQEELDAVDWCRERADDSDDESRKAKSLRDSPNEAATVISRTVAVPMLRQGFQLNIRRGRPIRRHHVA